jgi:kinetochor protein Mis14/NSL1
MDPHHRKIDLQSPLDLEYLSATINEAAQKKIDLHLPPNAQPSDDADSFQARVNELVHQVRTLSFHPTSAN